MVNQSLHHWCSFFFFAKKALNQLTKSSDFGEIFQRRKEVKVTRVVKTDNLKVSEQESLDEK